MINFEVNEIKTQNHEINSESIDEFDRKITRLGNKTVYCQIPPDSAKYRLSI
jgi:hypothetical protein